MDVSDVDLDVSPATKKRKICDADVKLMSPALIRLRSHSGVVEDTPAAGSLVSPATLVNLNENYASSEPEVSSTSCCSRNSKSLDLDENGMEVIVASKENTQMMLSGELESTKRPKSENSHRRITPAKMAKHENSPRRIMPEKVPSRNEIEEFFAACEKDMFKRFREKYNFDFEKEEPLEGRNEWVQRIGT